MDSSKNFPKLLTRHKCDVRVKGRRVYFLIFILLSSPTKRKPGSVNMTKPMRTSGYVLRKITLEKSEVVTS
jgi:hypothetical protein